MSFHSHHLCIAMSACADLIQTASDSWEEDAWWNRISTHVHQSSGSFNQFCRFTVRLSFCWGRWNFPDPGGSLTVILLRDYLASLYVSFLSHNRVFMKRLAAISWNKTSNPSMCFPGKSAPSAVLLTLCTGDAIKMHLTVKKTPTHLSSWRIQLSVLKHVNISKGFSHWALKEMKVSSCWSQQDVHTSCAPFGEGIGFAVRGRRHVRLFPTALGGFLGFAGRQSR